MSSHLSSSMLSALADGELSREELAGVHEHLAGCPACTSQALSESLLKATTGRAGQRYAAPHDLQQRLAQLAARERTSLNSAKDSNSARARSPLWSARLGWLAMAAVLLIAIGIGLVQHRMVRSQRSSDQSAALVTEVCDQHIAALAAGPVPQVVSSDRHTVKPWFQGKIPFSFNLPENLPPNTTLDGANMTYLGSQPVAQLLYSIGRHRVSVFLRERSTSDAALPFPMDHAGFHVQGFDTDDLRVIAVSDVDPARLRELVAAIREAQSTGPQR